LSAYFPHLVKIEIKDPTFWKALDYLPPKLSLPNVTSLRLEHTPTGDSTSDNFHHGHILQAFAQITANITFLEISKLTLSSADLKNFTEMRTLVVCYCVVKDEFSDFKKLLNSKLTTIHFHFQEIDSEIMKKLIKNLTSLKLVTLGPYRTTKRNKEIQAYFKDKNCKVKIEFGYELPHFWK